MYKVKRFYCYIEHQGWVGCGLSYKGVLNQLDFIAKNNVPKSIFTFKFKVRFFFYYQLFTYRKVASSNMSRLEAHAGFFRLLQKGIFNPCVLRPFDFLISNTCQNSRLYRIQTAVNNGVSTVVLMPNLKFQCLTDSNVSAAIIGSII